VRRWESGKVRRYEGRKVGTEGEAVDRSLQRSTDTGGESGHGLKKMEEDVLPAVTRRGKEFY
jgi:hypothetical protein